MEFHEHVPQKLTVGKYTIHRADCNNMSPSKHPATMAMLVNNKHDFDFQAQ